MRGRWPGLGALLVVVGCAGGASTPVAAPPPLRAEAPAELAPETTEPPAGTDLRCLEITSLTLRGDYKPAVDLLATLEAAGISCGEDEIAAAAESGRQLEGADERIRRSTESQRAGDISGARGALQEALEIYPRYYWAQKLLRDLGESSASPEPELEGATSALVTAEPLGPGTGNMLEPDAATQSDIAVIRQLIAEQNLELARIAERKGDLAAASRWTLQALKAQPRDPAVQRGVVEYARLLGLKFFSAGALTPARELWFAASELDRTDQRLHDYLRQVDERLESLERIRRKPGS